MCDRIILIKDGHIVEDGTHQELMERGNEYCNLIRTFHSDDIENDTEVDSIEEMQDGANVISQHISEDCKDDTNEGMGCNQNTKEGSLVHSGETNAPITEENQHKEAVQDTKQEVVSTSEEDTTHQGCGPDHSLPDQRLDNNIYENDNLEERECARDVGSNHDCMEIANDEPEEDDSEEDDKYMSTESSPVRNRCDPQLDFIRALAADTSSLGACVDSEETIFYSGKVVLQDYNPHL